MKMQSIIYLFIYFFYRNRFRSASNEDANKFFNEDAN